MKKSYNLQFSLVHVILLVVFFIGFSASADVAKPTLNANWSFEFDIKPVHFAARYPNFGMNTYFIKSFLAIRSAEKNAEQENMANEVDSTIDEQHGLGLNGYFHHVYLEQNEADSVHISLK